MVVEVARRAERQVIGWWGNKGECAGRNLHRYAYPSRLGPMHRVFGVCQKCGGEKMLSNTTHARYVELGGVCDWARCRVQSPRCEKVSEVK